MIAHPDPKIYTFQPRKPLTSQTAMFIAAGYDGKTLSAFLKFYDPTSQKIHFWYDKTGHRSYCLSKNSLGDVAEKVGNMSTGLVKTERFDALKGETIPVVQIFARDPTSIGGRDDSIREFVETWESDIRYTDSYIHDTKLEPTMWYRINIGGLEATVPKPVTPSELVQDGPIRQAMMDRYFRVMEAPICDFRRIAVDIEVQNPKVNGKFIDRMPDPAEAEYPVIACSLASTDGVKRVLILGNDMNHNILNSGDYDIEFFDDEESLIAAIFKYLWDYPVVLTFNGDNFDFRYLYRRAIRVGFEPYNIPIEFHRNLMGLKYGIHIDLYRFFFNKGLQSYTFDSKYKSNDLDAIATALIGEGKLKHDEKIGEMSYVGLAAYGYQDAKITLKLTTYDNNLVMKVIIACCRIASQTPEDVTREGISGFFKSMLLREHRFQGYIVPRKEDIMAVKGTDTLSTKSLIKGKKYKGGMVVEPVLGIHFNATDLDFGSLYPSIFRNWNIGYETIRCIHEECKVNAVPGTTHWFCGKKISMESQIIGAFKDLRIKWYKDMAKKCATCKHLATIHVNGLNCQECSCEKSVASDSYYKAIAGGLKAMMVAAYGVFGSEEFPFYCPPAGESVTAIGRSDITLLIEEAKRIGITVLYGDTDSVFLATTDKEKINALIVWARKNLEMELELDKSYVWLALSGRKKNYVGLQLDGKVDMKGVTGKKKHTPKFIQVAFQQMIDILKQLHSPDDIPKVKEGIIRLVGEAEQTMKDGKVPLNDLAFHMTLSRDPETYIKNVPQHVRVARQRANSQAGDVIHFVKVKGRGKQGDVMSLEQAKPEDINIGKYQEFFKNTFIQVLDALGISWEELEGLHGQTTIFGGPMPTPIKKRSKKK